MGCLQCVILTHYRVLQEFLLNRSLGCSVPRAQGYNKFNATLLPRAFRRKPAAQSGTSSQKYISSPHFPLLSNPLKPPSPRDLGGRAVSGCTLKPPPHRDLCESGSHVTGLSREKFICGSMRNGSDLAAQMVPPPPPTQNMLAACNGLQK